MRQRSRDVTPPHVDHNCQIIAASGDEPLFSRPPFRRDAWLIPLYDFPFSDVKSIKGFLSKQPRVRGPREARGWSTRGGEVWVSRRGEGGGRDGGGLSLIPPPPNPTITLLLIHRFGLILRDQLPAWSAIITLASLSFMESLPGEGITCGRRGGIPQLTPQVK